MLYQGYKLLYGKITIFLFFKGLLFILSTENYECWRLLPPIVNPCNSLHNILL